MRCTSRSVTETRACGQRLAATLRGGELLLLRGPLGSGKTEFIKGLAKGLGIRQTIQSPTFTIFRVYRVTKHRRIKQLVHADLYRLSARHIASTGLLEYCGRPDTVVAVEWGERIPPSKLPVSPKKIFLKAGSTSHTISID